MADRPEIKLNPPPQYQSPYARRAAAMLRANDEVGARGRHAIARAFVYGLLDLADAIRGRTDG